MIKLLDEITNKNFEEANRTLEENFKVILEKKMYEMKKMYAAKMSEQNTHAERMKRLKMDVLEQNDDEPPATGNYRPLNNKPADMEKFNREMDKIKEIGKDSGGFQQQQRLGSGYSKLAEEDEIEEGIVDKVKKIFKPEDRPERDMRNIDNTPMRQKKLKIEPKKLEEQEELDEATRIGIVKIRVRGGQVQRRKKVSNVPGMSFRGGKLQRMSPAERRRRKLGAKKAARKSKAKRFQALRKRKLSIRKRQRLGG